MPFVKIIPVFRLLNIAQLCSSSFGRVELQIVGSSILVIRGIIYMKVRCGDMFKRLFIWLFDKRVLKAINEGCSYEEVKDLVRRLDKFGHP